MGMQAYVCKLKRSCLFPLRFFAKKGAAFLFNIIKTTAYSHFLIVQKTNRQ
jgi:hypothetical protein